MLRPLYAPAPSPVGESPLSPGESPEHSYSTHLAPSPPAAASPTDFPPVPHIGPPKYQRYAPPAPHDESRGSPLVVVHSPVAPPAHCPGPPPSDIGSDRWCRC